ncbi:MAG: TetR/AcrR family transcriptional regulator [Deferrisomatales bacterium]
MGKWNEWDRKGRERAEHIARVAAGLFSQKSYLATTMEDIAAAAGTSKGGMYHYFDSKTSVLFFLLSSYMDMTLEGLEAEVNQIPDPNDKLRFVIARHISIHVAHIAEGKVLLHEAHCLPQESLRVIQEKERRYYGIVSKIVEMLLGDRVERHKVPVVTFCLFGMCNWTYSWYDPAGPVNPEELAETIYRIFLAGLDGVGRGG